MEITEAKKQALIEHIKEVLQEYEEHGGIGYGEVVYRTALAALTAQPDDRIVDDGCYQRIGCVQVSDKLNCTWPLGTQFYTNPPAQILRLVDLPDCVGYLGGVGPVMSAGAVVESLRKQGYEVKS